MRIGRCLACKLMAMLVSDLCVKCESRYEAKITLKVYACEVCDQELPLSKVWISDELINICRICWEEMLSKAGDK